MDFFPNFSGNTFLPLGGVSRRSMPDYLRDRVLPRAFYSGKYYGQEDEMPQLKRLRTHIRRLLALGTNVAPLSDSPFSAINHTMWHLPILHKELSKRALICFGNKIASQNTYQNLNTQPDIQDIDEFLIVHELSSFNASTHGVVLGVTTAAMKRFLDPQTGTSSEKVLENYNFIPPNDIESALSMHLEERFSDNLEKLASTHEDTVETAFRIFRDGPRLQKDALNMG